MEGDRRAMLGQSAIHGKSKAAAKVAFANRFALYYAALPRGRRLPQTPLANLF